MLWRIARSHERNTAVAEELYQDICFALWQARGRVDEAENPRAYIARIATNQAISHVRREVRQPETRDDDRADSIAADAPRVDDALDLHQKKARLLAAVQELPLNWRLPVTLTLEGFKPREIAYVTGEGANTISLRLQRAKTALRKALAADQQDRGVAHDAR